MKVISVILFVLGIAAAGLYGVTAYQRSHLRQSWGIGAGGRSDRFGTEEGEIPKNGDLCGGTGGNGQIVSKGNNTITLKRQDGRSLLVHLAYQVIINTSSGSASVSDLQTGQRVTLVGGSNLDGSFTADTVVVCQSKG
jgi:hypothetical protein